jgi:hypothetical protein
MPGPSGFDFTQRADGSVVITHHGRAATVLRGSRAAKFLEDASADPQLAAARWTGNYKHGNERRGRKLACAPRQGSR